MKLTVRKSLQGSQCGLWVWSQGWESQASSCPGSGETVPLAANVPLHSFGPGASCNVWRAGFTSFFQYPQLWPGAAPKTCCPSPQG